MRVVTWNMNQQGARVWEFLFRTLDPDIVFLQEAVLPGEMPSGYDVLWTAGRSGGRWGSAILSRVGTLSVEWEDNSRGAVLLASSSIPSAEAISLASVHARVVERRVIPALRETIGELRARMGERFIVGGDLNTARSAAAAWPAYGHGEFWQEIEGWGFHERLPLDGRERQSYWREWQQNKLPTIGNTLQDDHIFVDAQTIEYVSRSMIWDTKEVRDLSDHGPFVLDLSLPGEG